MKNILLLLLLATSFSVMAESNFPDNRHIQIEGTGSVAAKPDRFQITFDITSIKDTSCNASLEVDNTVAKFLAGLSILNIKDENVTATNLSLETDYTYTEDDEEMISGYIAYRTITVVVPQIKPLNDFMEFLLSLGIDEVNDIEPMSSDIKKYQAMATKKAVEDAKAKGQILASAFGAKLGKVYSINASLYDSEYDYISTEDIVHIVKSETATGDDKIPKKYLEATINYSSTISVIFDLKVR